MTRWLAVLLLVFIFATGCATEKFVTDRTVPLANRLSDVEGRMDKADDRLGTLEKRVSDLEMQVGTLKGAPKVDVEGAIGRAEKAARDAEEAAKRAEDAAMKAQKAFEMKLKK
jgi:predicted  nucleic acid-binding Zn-ribbon protein